MKNNVIQQIMPKDTPDELSELIKRCYVEKPAKKDLDSLAELLNKTPGLYKSVFNTSQVVRNKIIEAISELKPVYLAAKANVAEIKNQLGYDKSPMIERMLIDQVINAWLRYQWAELKYTINTIGEHSFNVGEYWLQVLGAAQRRYLHSVEVLARVRKITRATMQINIAEYGSRQVNIAGDIHKK